MTAEKDHLISYLTFIENLSNFDAQRQTNLLLIPPDHPPNLHTTERWFAGFAMDTLCRVFGEDAIAIIQARDTHLQLRN